MKIFLQRDWSGVQGVMCSGLCVYDPRTPQIFACLRAVP